MCANIFMHLITYPLAKPMQSSLASLTSRSLLRNYSLSMKRYLVYVFWRWFFVKDMVRKCYRLGLNCKYPLVRFTCFSASVVLECLWSCAWQGPFHLKQQTRFKEYIQNAGVTAAHSRNTIVRECVCSLCWVLDGCGPVYWWVLLTRWVMSGANVKHFSGKVRCCRARVMRLIQDFESYSE